MEAKELRPYVLLTLDEGDELNSKIAKVYALADLLNCAFEGPDEPESKNLAEIFNMFFIYSQEVKNLWEEGMKRESAARKEATGRAV